MILRDYCRGGDYLSMSLLSDVMKIKVTKSRVTGLNKSTNQSNPAKVVGVALKVALMVVTKSLRIFELIIGVKVENKGQMRQWSVRWCGERKMFCSQGKVKMMTVLVAVLPYFFSKDCKTKLVEDVCRHPVL